MRHDQYMYNRCLRMSRNKRNLARVLVTTDSFEVLHAGATWPDLANGSKMQSCSVQVQTTVNIAAQV